MLSFLKDTVYSNMAPLFIGPNLLIVSKEPKAKELLKALRASPQITLLGMFISWIYGQEKNTGSPIALHDLDFCSTQARV